MEGGIYYCKRWEAEDCSLTPIERTRRILAGAMGGVEPFLTFTTETREDYTDGWLPTLDTSIQVSEDNRILFRFYENPTNSNRNLDKRTALCENQKMTILSQEMIRRLAELPKQEYVRTLDKFSQKLYNSGYSVAQVRRTILSGIKRWGGKMKRCKEGERWLRRPTKDSLGARLMTKLVGKSTWFKRKGEQNKKVGEQQGGRAKEGGGTQPTPPILDRSSS